MNFKAGIQALTAALALLLPLAAFGGHGGTPGPVDISVVLDNGRELPLYALRDHAMERDFRAYLEARPGREYRIRVRNRSAERIGLVIAVDGRNIISGERSKLRRDERMYVIGPHDFAEYAGWRTDRHHVHRFYFTDERDSYAGAWGDYSAMGVIAVAAFREREPAYYGYRDRDGRRSEPPRAQGRHMPAPGTGFGEAEHSQAVRVEFEPERRPVGRYFLKYEWRQTLCELGVADCGRPNRFWPHAHNGFAPYPPGPHRR